MFLTRHPGVRDAVDAVILSWRRYNPSGRKAFAAVQAKRDRVNAMLADLARASTERFSGEVLIDSQWYNPNYWLRVSLLRAALGLAYADEVGLLGKYRRDECVRTMTDLGIRRIRRHADIAIDKAAIRRRARDLVAATRSAEDVLDWELPEGVPAAMVYDGILKRQRLATLDVRRGDFRRLVEEGLVGIARAKRILDEHDFRLVVISHPFNFTYGTIAHQALARGIPVVLPFGLFGVVRMTHFHEPADLTTFYDRPRRSEMDALPAARAEAMRDVGQRYLAGRFGGKADDLASVYAFQKRTAGIDRDGICRRFGWDPGKPIVGMYTSNWFDWPHQLGMTQFRDFLDWTEQTFRVASQNASVNWLFKPHPCEEWFGGVSLATMMREMGTAAHVGIADTTWNNTAVMGALDALVTYHGTAGIEFASLGKPVLLPDRGKYDDCGFAKMARGRADYLDLLTRRWWDDMDLDDCRRRAEIFAGWWFCAPTWQGDFILGDDARIDALYDLIPGLIENNRNVVAREIEHLRDWYRSGHPYSHTYKMMHADAFKLTNV